MKQEKLNELLLKENNDIINHYILFRNQDLEQKSQSMFADSDQTTNSV